MAAPPGAGHAAQSRDPRFQLGALGRGEPAPAVTCLKHADLAAFAAQRPRLAPRQLAALAPRADVAIGLAQLARDAGQRGGGGGPAHPARDGSRICAAAGSALSMADMASNVIRMDPALPPAMPGPGILTRACFHEAD